MTREFEDELRRQLRATSAPSLGVDPMDIVETGHRTITRRRILAGAGGLALAATAGGAVALTRQKDRTPADPASSAWKTIDLPVPGVDAAFVRVQLPTTKARAGDRYGYQFSDESGKVENLMDGELPGAGQIVHQWAPMADASTFLAVIGGQVQTLFLPDEEHGMQVRQTVTALPDLGLTCVVGWVEDYNSDSDLLSHELHWLTTEGVLHSNGSDSPLPQQAVELEGEPFVIAADDTTQERVLVVDRRAGVLVRGGSHLWNKGEGLVPVRTSPRVVLAMVPKTAQRIEVLPASSAGAGQARAQVTIEGVDYTAVLLKGKLELLWIDDRGRTHRPR